MEVFLTGKPIFIVGASLSPEKFGYKVLDWYIRNINNRTNVTRIGESSTSSSSSSTNPNNLIIVPIHPKESMMMGLVAFPSIKDFLCDIMQNEKFHGIKSVSLDDAAIHFITPPDITRSYLETWTLTPSLQSSKSNMIKKIWCQPGSLTLEDGKRIESVLSQYPGSVFLHHGPCILRDVDSGMVETIRKQRNNHGNKL